MRRPSRRASRDGSSMAASPTATTMRCRRCSEIPYDKWREYDAEDTIRFYALRLHEAGHDQVEPAEDHRRRHRLAFLERAQTRAEGVSAKDREVSMPMIADPTPLSDTAVVGRRRRPAARSPSARGGRAGAWKRPPCASPRAPAICIAAAICRRGTAARRGLHRYPLCRCRLAAASTEQLARGDVDFDGELCAELHRRRSMRANRSRCWPACMSAASNCSATNDIRSIADLKGKTVGVPGSESSQHMFADPDGRRMSGSTRARTSTGSPIPSAEADEICSSRARSTRSSAFRRSRRNLRARSIGHVIVNTHRRPPMVAIFLLHARRATANSCANTRSRPSA